MWIRKTSIELSVERRNRKRIGLSFLVGLILLSMFAFYGIWRASKPFGWLEMNYLAVLMGVAVGAALLFYACRNFVLYGSPLSTQAKMMCVICKKELGCGEALGVVKSSGNHRKWLQIQSCHTPEACIPVYKNEVKWVNAVKEKQYRG